MLFPILPNVFVTPGRLCREMPKHLYLGYLGEFLMYNIGIYKQENPATLFSNCLTVSGYL